MFYHNSTAKSKYKTPIELERDSHRRLYAVTVTLTGCHFHLTKVFAHHFEFLGWSDESK